MGNYDNYDHYNNKHHSESNWLQEQFRKYKMHQMMKEMMHGNFEDSEPVQFKPYSMDHGMKNSMMKKFEMMKMMKDMMKDNRYSDSFKQHDMMKMMKNVFGNEYSNDHYDMMEKYFKNDNDMDAFEMMKMMMKFSGDESNIDMSQMMHSMEKMYGNNYKMNEHDMMKMMNEKNFESHDYKTDNYAPPQAGYNRYKRQVYKPQARNTEQRLDKGDRLFAKLQEQKRGHEEHVGNMTCVLKETKVLNKENKIDVQSLKQYMQQYTLPSPWFKKNFEELVDICYETAVNLPADIVEDQIIEGDFGPINSILKETKLTEFQLFPLVQEMLQGEESEY